MQHIPGRVVSASVASEGIPIISLVSGQPVARGLQGAEVAPERKVSIFPVRSSFLQLPLAAVSRHLHVALITTRLL